MPSRTLRRGPRPELQANRKIEPSREAQPLENKDNAAAISAHLRALIPARPIPCGSKKWRAKSKAKLIGVRRWARLFSAVESVQVSRLLTA